MDQIYLIECPPQATVQRIAAQIRAVRSLTNTDNRVIVDDDCQRLGDSRFGETS